MSVIAPEATRDAARLAAEAARPKVVLHSLYSHNGHWVAELAEGQRLALALVGMKIRGHRVVGIEPRGLVLQNDCSSKEVRAKSRCGRRILSVGEAL